MAPAAGGVWFSTHVPQHPAILNSGTFVFVDFLEIRKMD
jgi:hypothetical protein